MKTSNPEKKGSNIWLFLIIFVIASCGKKSEEKAEQLTYSEFQHSTPTGIATEDSPDYGQLTSSSSSVLLTGIDRVRLIPIYKIGLKTDKDIQYSFGTTYFSYWDKDEEDHYKYFMPGIDIIYGYHLINIGHYDVETEKLSYFFENPVLIRTLYFPGLKKDSLRHRPVSRDYFLVSVYDEDTNQDSVINTKDIRKFYHIDQFNQRKTQLIPPDYSAMRSTYDYKNDIMYLYTRHDANHNGIPEKDEPVAIYWIRLNDPTVVKRMR